METNPEKIVDFSFCRTCENWEEDESENEKCHECLYTPTNLYSRKPINYKEKSSSK